MQTTSGKAREELLETLEEQLADGADARAIASDLFGLVAVLDSEPALRRVLTEPSVPPEAKKTIVRSLLEGKVAEPSLKVALSSVGNRWSTVADLPNSVEYAAVAALADQASRSGDLDSVEDDLFRFGRILEAEPALRDALSDAAAPMEAKRRLVHSLLDDKVGAVTVALVDQVLMLRHRSLPAGLEYFQQVVAARRDRLVATVWVASPLTGEQKRRLSESLARDYNHDVHLNVIVDGQVLGGVRVAIGDDVIDSTVQTRLAQAQRRVVR